MLKLFRDFLGISKTPKPPQHIRIPKGINAVTVYCQVKIMKNKMKKITIILYTNKNQLSTKTPHKPLAYAVKQKESLNEVW